MKMKMKTYRSTLENSMCEKLDPQQLMLLRNALLIGSSTA